MQKLVALGLLAIATAFGSGTASAATEVPVFDGIVKLTAVNEACEADGWVAGTEYRLIYRSEVRPSNERGGGIQMLDARGGFNFMQPNKKALPGGSPKGTFTATGISGQVGIYTFSSPFALTITPTKVRASSKVVTIEGTLGNFSAVEGCTVTIFGVATPRN
jgi:hypothetical protein